MEAIEYLKEKKRMTEGCPSSFCGECPLESDNNGKGDYCGGFEQKYPEKAVAIVEQWSKEHPIKTYKSVLLEKFPKADIDILTKNCLMHTFGDCAGLENCHTMDCAICWNRECKE